MQKFTPEMRRFDETKREQKTKTEYTFTKIVEKVKASVILRAISEGRAAAAALLLERHALKGEDEKDASGFAFRSGRGY